MNLTRVAFIVTAACLPALWWPGSAPAAAGDDCVTCHARLLEGSSVHAAAESCDTCHEPVQTGHPQKGVKTFKLTQSQPELCGTCHDLPGKMKVGHPPANEGDCTACHDPHSAPHPKLLREAQAALCASCHDSKASAAHVHGPVSAGECTTCHAPHESDNAKLLVKPGDALCFGCHVEMKTLAEKPHHHAALDGGCTSCHDPHGSAHPRLLAESGAQLCYQCHADVEESVKGAAVPHPPVQDGKGCVECHNPHAADRPRLLMKPEKDLCLACHPGAISAAMTHLHAPVRDGQCTACHTPHGGAHRGLLVADYPAGEYTPYTPSSYGLCFGCHNRDLLQYPDTSFATGFRDGEKNLHYVHVNREKGRTCLLCHDVHGAASEKLISQSVPFGKWRLPLKFVKTETGGSCTPGCHKQLAYDREVPGRAPPAAK